MEDHKDFLLAQELVYAPHNFFCTNLKKEAESASYGACTFDLDGKHVLFRVAKITPTKIGQFVTLWKRNSDGITIPFDAQDAVDLVIISVRSGENVGQFIFSKDVALRQDIFSNNHVGGKRGFRVYPPWDTAPNLQAVKTQQWQNNYFVELQPHVDSARLQQLLNDK